MRASSLFLIGALAGCGGRVDEEPAPIEPQHRAEAVIGGYDRVHVYRSIPSRGVCLFLGLVRPARPRLSGALDVKTPEGWSVEAAWAGALDCKAERLATQGSGTVSFSPGADSPCAVDLDVTLTLPLSGRSPEHETLRARGVRIENACR